MAKLYNLARMTTATTSTGTITLGSAVSGCLTFDLAGVQNGEIVSYGIKDGANSEVGYGTYTSSGTTLARTTILKSTNSDAAINLSGTAEVFITALAETISFHGCSVRMYSNTYEVAGDGTVTYPEFDYENFDTDNYHDLGTNPDRITIPTGLGGKYLVTLHSAWDSRVGGAAEMYLRPSDSSYDLCTANQLFLAPPGSWNYGLEFYASQIANIDEGVYLTPRVSQNSGVTLTVFAVWVTMVYLGS